LTEKEYLDMERASTEKHEYLRGQVYSLHGNDKNFAQMEVREAAMAYGKRFFTVEEYLEMENASTEKHEYYRGEIFNMAGAKFPHVQITDNLHFQLRSKLSGIGCKPYNSDLRIYVELNGLYTYPDVSVFCGEPQFLNNDQLNALNPTVLFEVLSESNRSYDRGEKFMLYRQIPSLREFIIIDSLSVKAEAWAINAGGHWQLKEDSDLTASLELPSLNVSIALADIYEGVRFGEA